MPSQVLVLSIAGTTEPTYEATQTTMDAQEMAQQVSSIIENHRTAGTGVSHCARATMHSADMLLEGLHMRGRGTVLVFAYNSSSSSSANSI
jgi:hypothetical protein